MDGGVGGNTLAPCLSELEFGEYGSCFLLMVLRADS